MMFFFYLKFDSFYFGFLLVMLVSGCLIIQIGSDVVLSIFSHCFLVNLFTVIVFYFVFLYYLNYYFNH